MDNTLFSNPYRFYEILRNTYHYSDNRGGSPEHYVAYMLCGSCRITSPRGTIHANTGDVFYIPKGLPYQSYWYGKPEIRFLSFGFQQFPEAAQSPYALQIVDCSPELKARLQALPLGLNPNSATLGAFYTLLAALLPSMQTDAPNRNEQLYRAARQQLVADPAITATRLARALGISESSLYTVFKACGNKTPNAVRREVLCEKAVILLTTTDKSVQEISDLLHFSSTSYFRKILKLHTGMSPREIRRNATAM